MRIHVFTYGTLRPGGALSSGMPGDHIGPAVLTGAALFRHRYARFPVVDLTIPDMDVVGDVFSVNVLDLDFVAPMELDAGYDAAWRTVTLNDDDYTEVTALVFAWPDHLPVGPIIPSGDWFGLDAVEACSNLDVNAGFARRKSNR